MTTLKTHLTGRNIILIGLMGAGKTSVGRQLARMIEMPFTDADAEIARAAGCSIPDIFSLYGEAAFREGERRVIGRLMNEGPMVLATGGGAFMDEETRTAIRQNGISVWLRASIDTLVRRIGRRHGRPMLTGGDTRVILEGLAELRHPVFIEADIIVNSTDEPTERTVKKVIASLKIHASQPALPVAVRPSP